MKEPLLSSGAIPVCYLNHEWFVLILRAFKNWDFPKGMVEKGEDPWTGALREVAEETGITEFSTPWEKTYIETEPYGKGKIARYYLIQLDHLYEVSLLPNPVTGIIEHHEYEWVSFEEAKKRLVPRLQKVLDWAQHTIEH